MLPGLLIVGSVSFLLLMVFVVLMIRAARGRPPRPIALPNQTRRYFFTRPEQRFFSQLVKAVRQISPSLTVFSKVRMGDLLIMTKGTTGRSYWAAWGRISQRHADFVILRPIPDSEEPGALEPVLVIELDDASHELEHRRRRDTLVDAIYAHAGLDIIHVPVAPHYDELLGQIAHKLGMPVVGPK